MCHDLGVSHFTPVRISDEKILAGPTHLSAWPHRVGSAALLQRGQVEQAKLQQISSKTREITKGVRMV